MEARKQPPLWTIAGFLLGLILIFYWKVLFTGAAMFPWDAAISLLAAVLSLSYLDRSLRIRKLARQVGATSDSIANLTSDPTSDPNSNSARGPSQL